MQERGNSYINPCTGQRYSRKPFRKYHDHDTDLLFGEIPELANDLFEIYRSHPKCFPALSEEHMGNKNVAREKEKVTRWILNDRREMNRADITNNSFPKLYKHLDKIPIHESDTIFALEQSSLLLKAQIMWGSATSKLPKTPTKDTRH